ncbi:MAG: cell division protein FtsQ/DivIB, partial [Azospirillaceae bacterium]
RRPMPRAAARALRWGGFGGPAAALIVGGLWAVTSGAAADAWTRTGEAALDATAGLGFSVQEVLVAGRHATDGDLLLETLDVDRGAPILAFDPDRARDAIEALPWVRTATVERRLPDTVFVSLVERRPLALWQHDGRFQVIDAEGVVLTERGLDRFDHLPMVVGGDAPENARALLEVLDSVPAVADRVEAAIRVGQRRWNLRLDNGVTVRLPEAGLAGALARLAAVERDDGLLDRDIRSIDLRIAGRLVIRTTPVANELRLLPEENT